MEHFLSRYKGLHFSTSVERLVLGELERKVGGIQLKASKFAEVFV